ncbi:MAG: hypothetical protein DHS20C21_20840 [Gemmatimonadota bacterium]|nr:MAG: hypothetical protein DHS20C21_20840 [Gemmatimonadota bacterium]
MNRKAPSGFQLPIGVTSIEGDSGFVIWNLSYPAAARQFSRDATGLARSLARYPVSGIALDLTDVSGSTEETTNAVLGFVDELQSLGLSVVTYGAGGDFLTALNLDGGAHRVATRPGLAEAVSVIREYDEMRQRCTSDRGQRVNQLRMPARALSLAPLCAYTRARLEGGGAPPETAHGLLRECYAALGQILADGFEPGDGDLSISVTVHDGRATITVLDAGRPRENAVIQSDGDQVDRIHRFRILDRHNAIVLEKDLTPVAS